MGVFPQFLGPKLQGAASPVYCSEYLGDQGALASSRQQPGLRGGEGDNPSPTRALPPMGSQSQAG